MRQFSYEEALACVDTLCRAILGRPADGEGWALAARALHEGHLTEEQMATNFMTSPEFEARGRIKALLEPSVEPVFFQTADPVVYREMLDITSKTVIAYCERHGFRYESFIGVKRGAWPWHATYNRLFMFKELMDRGFRGWAVYLDADAFIADQSFDLRHYLADKTEVALIGTLAFGHADPSIPGNGPHNVNAGVLLANLGHPIGRALIEDWLQRYRDIPEYIVRQAEHFDVGMHSDQALLHQILAENPHYLNCLHHENWKLINSPQASFIRQHLRAMYASFDERLAGIAGTVDEVMGKPAARRSPAPFQEHEDPMAAVRAELQFRTPQALRVEMAPPKRALVVGSCLSEGLVGWLRARGCDCDFVLFNNVGQLPPEPPRPLADYDFQVVQIPLRSVLPEMAYFRIIGSDDGWNELLAEAEERLRQLFEAITQWSRGARILTLALNFLPPQDNPLGRTMPRHGRRNMVRFIQHLNDRLSEEIEACVNCYVVDCDEISASYGRRYVQDDVYMQLNHAGVMPEDGREHDMERIQTPSRIGALYPNRQIDFMSAVVDEMLAIHRIVQRAGAVKLVIIDLDDTLWRGLVVESWRGAGHATEGYPLGLAEALLFLKARGIVLAIVSKNDPDKIAQVWDHVWQGRLSLDDFAVRQINWRSKQENVAAVIQAVNVRPDSVLFIDDNPVERAAVQASFPEIRVLGDEPFVLRRILLSSPETQVPAITRESARRTEMVQSQVAREETRSRMSREEFLASLNVQVRQHEIRALDDPRFERCLELINKTNQFNTTGRRLTVEECGQAFAEGAVFHAFEVQDKFTDYGLVGAAVARGTCIEQFVMSCRVIGLDVEFRMIGAVVEALRREGRRAVSAQMAATPANTLCRDVFKQCGFVLDGEFWTLPTPSPAAGETFAAAPAVRTSERTHSPAGDETCGEEKAMSDSGAPVTTLTDLADRNGSDKGTKHPEPHHYTRVYDMLLQPRRSALTRMLEIGLYAGGPEVGGSADRQDLDLPSVKMWLSYFPNAIVQGFDISDFSFFQHPRFEFTRGDSGSEADLRAAVEGRGLYDLIIDDGSHASFHQQLAFQCLFPALRPGGLYIIEDLHWQSPYYEDALPHTFKTADLIRSWFRTGKFPDSPAPQLSGLSRLAQDIDLAFIMNQPFAEHDWPKLAVIQKRW